MVLEVLLLDVLLELVEVRLDAQLLLQVDRLLHALGDVASQLLLSLYELFYFVYYSRVQINVFGD